MGFWILFNFAPIYKFTWRFNNADLRLQLLIESWQNSLKPKFSITKYLEYVIFFCLQKYISLGQTQPSLKILGPQVRRYYTASEGF